MHTLRFLQWMLHRPVKSAPTLSCKWLVLLATPDFQQAAHQACNLGPDHFAGHLSLAMMHTSATLSTAHTAKASALSALVIVVKSLLCNCEQLRACSPLREPVTGRNACLQLLQQQVKPCPRCQVSDISWNKQQGAKTLTSPRARCWPRCAPSPQASSACGLSSG